LQRRPVSLQTIKTRKHSIHFH